jgi:hypothetical protein
MLVMEKHSSLLCRIISLAYPQLKILAKAECSTWENTLAYFAARSVTPLMLAYALWQILA